MHFRSLFLGACLIPILAFAANPQEPAEDSASSQLRNLQWHEGPGVMEIAGKASLKTDEALLYLDEKNSSEFLKLTGNLPSPGNFILLSSKDNWWASFSFNPTGYIKDDEKIDADALLKDIKSRDEPANEERKRLGLQPLFTEGWYIPPHYDPETKRLEWGIRLRSNGEEGLNYTIRFLGRTGVMSATLVSSPQTLQADVRSFKSRLPGFDFKDGEKYAEFKQGDRVAEFGLGALIVGGAAAVATKKGLWGVIGGFFAAFWKIIAGVAVAGFASLKSVFKRKQQ